MSNSTGILYVVATPIGHLADISRRAIEVLSTVDLIAAEDTRHTASLLQYHNIRTPMIAYHDHNEIQEATRLAKLIAGGTKIALVSDAGTPLINDPGFRLVQEIKKLGLSITPIPGPCALICALSASGLPSDRFLFLGFPPRGEKQREQLFSSIATEPGTLIFYESGQRLQDTIESLKKILGIHRRAVLARELTKLHETFIDGTLETLATIVNSDPMQIKGEHVLLVTGTGTTPLKNSEDAKQILTVLLEELPVKQAVKLAAKISGHNRNELYRWALEIGDVNVFQN